MKRGMLLFFICFVWPTWGISGQEGKDFLLNLTKGVVYPLHYETEMELSYSMPNAMGSSGLFLSIDYLCKVVDKDIDSYTLWIYIDELKIDNLNVEPFNEDLLHSEFKLFWAKHSNNFIYAIQDNYFVAKISKRGALLLLSNQESFHEDSIKTLSQRLSIESHKPLLDAFFSFLFKEVEEQFKSLYEFHPGKMVTINSSWKQEYSTSQLAYNYNYLYQRTTNDYDFITVTGDYIMPTMTKEFGLATKGWLHGYYVLDKKTGWIIGSNIEGSINAKESILIQGIQAFLKIKVVAFRRN